MDAYASVSSSTHIYPSLLLCRLIISFSIFFTSSLSLSFVRVFDAPFFLKMMWIDKNSLQKTRVSFRMESLPQRSGSTTECNHNSVTNHSWVFVDVVWSLETRMSGPPASVCLLHSSSRVVVALLIISAPSLGLWPHFRTSTIPQPTNIVCFTNSRTDTYILLLSTIDWLTILFGAHSYLKVIPFNHAATRNANCWYVASK